MTTEKDPWEDINRFPTWSDYGAVMVDVLPNIAAVTVVTVAVGILWCWWSARAHKRTLPPAGFTVGQKCFVRPDAWTTDYTTDTKKPLDADLAEGDLAVGLRYKIGSAGDWRVRDRNGREFFVNEACLATTDRWLANIRDLTTVVKDPATADFIHEARQAFGRPSAPKPKKPTAFDDAVARWLSYQRDLDMIVKHPAMTDLSIPEVAAAARAYLAVTDQETDQARLDFRFALEAAERKVDVVRLSRYTPDQAKSIENARTALALALGSGASDVERQNALRRALRLLEGVVSVPQQALEAIEHRVALSLTSH